MDGRFLVVVAFLIERDHHDARFPIIGREGLRARVKVRDRGQDLLGGEARPGERLRQVTGKWAAAGPGCRTKRLERPARWRAAYSTIRRIGRASSDALSGARHPGSSCLYGNMDMVDRVRSLTTRPEATQPRT
jgi:hypothetical protein